jgi:predicted dehydrogenase/sugar phosphate isomerase/epimerase
MPETDPPADDSPPTRRDFLAASGAALAALDPVPAVHAAGSDLLRVGLVGCGGRGTGAAAQALRADDHVKLVAMADAFEDRLDKSLATLRQDEKVADKVDVKPDHRFVGFDAYKDLLAAGVDVVLLCTPPHFRPAHLGAAVAAGKHLFAEKPVAVDAPGVRSVLASCQRARERNLSVVSGLCLRYDRGFRETVRRLHEGAVGDVVALQANDFRGSNWARPRQPGWTDMQWQMRNWYNFTWLSGDFNVEQHVHFLDVCAWVMKDAYPDRAAGTGGRQVRNAPEHGHIYDHFAVVYEYASGVKLFSHCRQQPGCKNDASAHALGTRGRAELSERRKGLAIHAGGDWHYAGPANDMYQTEHVQLFAGIRSGKPINNGDYMARSTLLAIMGRMAAYTGQLITWEMALNSREELSPPAYDWKVPLPVPPVAIPGKTRERTRNPQVSPKEAFMSATPPDRRFFLRLGLTGLAGLGVAATRSPAADPAPPAAKGVATKFQIACMTLPYAAFPLERALQGIKAAGYRFVAWGTTHQESGGKAVPVLAGDEAPGKAKELGQRCRDRGLEPVMMFGPGPEALDALRQRVRQAAAAGVGQVLTMGSTRGNDPKVWVRNFKAVGPAARDQGVVVAVKQHGGNTGTGAALAEIVREVNDEGVKISYDAGNVMDYHKIDPLPDVRKCAAEVRSFCIKDHRLFPRDQDCGPGFGEIDHYRLLAPVAFTGRVMPLCCENIFAPVIPRPADPDAIDGLARRAREFLEVVTAGLQAP